MCRIFVSDASPGRRAFTLVELLLVLAIVSALVAILLPALARGRQQGRSAACLSNLRQFLIAWHMYADMHQDVMMPGRHCYEGAPPADPASWNFVGNGLKYCPRGVAMLGGYIGANPFSRPSVSDSRQDYESRIYQCPEAPEWIDERNSGYGYNYQFLGNNRRRSPTSRYYNFPVNRSALTALDRTVVFADSLGTAAGVAADLRRGYLNNGSDPTCVGNHGWSLDPPRLTATSDRGTFNPSPRTAVDPRHLRGRVNSAWADGHGQTDTPYALGYRLLPSGAYVDLEKVADAPNNRSFSGHDKDLSPPDKPLN